MIRSQIAFGGKSPFAIVPYVALPLVLSALPAPAAAQVGFALHLEGGGATMLSSHQRDVLGFDNGGTVMVRPELRMGDIVGLELQAGALWFPSSVEVGSVYLGGAGVRIQPMLGDALRLVFDGHASYANTAGLSRLALDAGFALEFQAGDNFAIGPYVRYTQLFASRNEGGDAMMLSYGLTMAVGTSRHPARADSDRDGFFDDEDVCIREAAGERPDAQRAGCPLPVPVPVAAPAIDTDGDRIVDTSDLCPAVPAGERPDPTRRGCPLADADSDGVFGEEDLCPAIAAGPRPDPTRRGCPDADDDGDGVPNSTDVCPTEHHDVYLSPDPARLGCPIADRDHDTVPDATDRCPDVAGAPSPIARRNGCPGLLSVERNRIRILEPLLFATGSDTVLPRSRAILAALAHAMRVTPRIRRLTLEGHTDDVGTHVDNRELSARRANSVMQWLIAHGVEATRLEARAMGETDPTAGGSSEDAREQNRQVDFLVTDPAPVRSEGVSR